MFVGRIGVLLLAILWLWPSDLYAQSEALMKAYRQGKALEDAGQYEQAIPFYRKVLELGEGELSPDPPSVAADLNNLAELYRAQGRYAEAEPLYKRALTILEKALGPDHPNFATALNNLAELYRAQGRYAEAEPLYKRALVIGERTLGTDHPYVATTLNNLALLYEAQGMHVDAEPLHERALAIYENVLGPEHPQVAASLNNLAGIYNAQGRYNEAERLYERSLAIKEKALGPEHPGVALSLNNMAALYRAQGRHREAEPLFKRALAIQEKALGPDNPSVANSLNNLAELYRAQGRYAEAEPLYKRALVISEKALGPEHPDLVMTLHNLAGIYRVLGKYSEVEPLSRRVLAIREKALGPEHPDVAQSLYTLANLYQAQGRYTEAEGLYKRALAIYEKGLGSEDFSVAMTLSSLAAVYGDQGRYAQAELLMDRAIAIWEQTQTPEPADPTFEPFAHLFDSDGRFLGREILHKSNLAFAEKMLGRDHPWVADELNNLALLYSDQGRDNMALAKIRRATAIHRRRMAQYSGGLSRGIETEQALVRDVFLNHVLFAAAAATKDSADREALLAEIFEVGQFAQATSTARAVDKLGARFAAGNDALAKDVRTHQDAVEQWRDIDAQLVKAVSEPPHARDADMEARLRAQLKSLDQRIQALNAQFVREFPEYAELASPQPVPLVEAQALLAEDEALLTYLVWDDRSFVFVVRRDRALARQITLGAKELGEAVTALRKGLDPINVRTLENIPPFDTTRAFQLYRKLFQPVEPLLEGVRHVFVVPDGALQSLPLGVLVTEKPQGGFTDFAGYRQVPWLARKYAMTTLPSVSSLRALRSFAKRAKASRPFLGVGDPKLDGETGSGRGVKLASLFTSRGVADVDAVRQLASLPETAGELRSLARTLGASDEALLLGTEATETRVKQARLDDYKVLAFATHALVAGELTGLSEPALVLTPPAKGTEQDDGLLTASEVAQLKLDADLVILSACNTAAADGTPGAEGLSGLAKAFFYAGARTLLVSHWAVASDAAVALTTGMLEELADQPRIGRAEALRRSMLSLMANEEKDYFAHPMFWAPFVVVGEGARPRIL